MDGWKWLGRLVSVDEISKDGKESTREGKDQYKQFVSNRIKKIKEKGAEFRYVPTNENPADIGSRGANSLRGSKKWLHGPEWPADIATVSTAEAETEKKLIKEILNVTVSRTSDNIDEVIEKGTFWRTVRILAWCKRFIHNCRTSQRNKRPLTTDETNAQGNFLIKRAQGDVKDTERFDAELKRLNLRENEDRI
eukprot:gene10617-biopygen7759